MLCSGIRNGLWLVTQGSESPPLLHPQPTTNDSKNVLCGRVLSVLLFRVILPVIYPGLAGQSATSLTATLCFCQLLRLPLRLHGARQCFGFDTASRFCHFTALRQLRSAGPHDTRDNADGFGWAVNVYSVLKD